MSKAIDLTLMAFVAVVQLLAGVALLVVLFPIALMMATWDVLTFGWRR